jgi:two-component system cell cycle response regulator
MRIVLVDPSRAVQRAMARLIEEGGHEVLTFAEGLKALAYVNQDAEVRALITSTQPLDISGIELCSAARTLSGTRRALHVLLMSSTNDYYLAITALDNGADDFIHKPPIPDELRARLRLADRVTSMKQQLIQYASTDALTGILNRRAFFDDAMDTARIDSVLSAILFDVDHFKQINDRYGHDVGDRVLAAVAAETKMAGGIAGRLGGEEFCVLVKAAIADASDRAREMQACIRSLRFNSNNSEFSVTCSFGVAELEKDDTIDRLIRRADVAMYQAKSSGRDRIVLSDSFALTDGHDKWRGVARVGERGIRHC